MVKVTAPNSDEQMLKQGGKPIAVTDKDVAHGQTTTYRLEKQ